MRILNLGCGAKTSVDSNVVNIDWSILLRIKKSKLLNFLSPLFLKGERLEKFKLLPDNIMVYNLAKGIPFDSDSIDVVYHSHVLEHLDIDVAEKFLIEVKRVLKPGGIHRIVVPDLESVCLAYITHIIACETSPDESYCHDSHVAKLLEQSVRKEASGTSQQNLLRRSVENLILGDARRRGETHQWMYDRINLREKLINVGYSETHVQGYNTSLIQHWSEYGLDIDEKGNQYKPESLYMEAVK